jgi:hypothetical protein
MAGRGYLLALDGPCIALMLAAEGDDRRVIEVIKELDVTGAPDECGADKAWDGIHRCLTEGRLGSEDGACPTRSSWAVCRYTEAKATSSATTPG